jgi:hypothetical protein
MASGFVEASIEYRSPIPAAHRLQPLRLPEHAGLALLDVVETFNSNVDKLNARMFTYMDYAIVARKTDSRIS